MRHEFIDEQVVETSQTDYSRLRDLIRSDIVNDHLKGGSRLKVRDLAARYSTSAIPVREALQQLQGEGIVNFIANRGARVRVIDTDFVSDIYEIRGLVEPFLGKWFVRHHREGELERLIAIQQEYDAAVAAGEWQKLRSLNREFHGVCYNSHYNTEAVQIAYKHNDLINALADRFPRSRSRAMRVCSEHWAIIDAIRAQDEAQTAHVVENHVRNSGQHLIERMKATSQAAPATGARNTR